VTSIWSSIVEEYHSRGGEKFWASQFVRPQVSEAEVLTALRRLVDCGQLQAEAVLFCEDGHRAWVGPASQLADHLNQACPTCDLPIENEVAELRFRISPSAKSTLDASATTLQKKTPQIH